MTTLKVVWHNAIAVGVTLLAAAALFLSGTPVAQHPAPGAVAQMHLVAGSIPQRAWTTLDLIDQGKWPPADCPGTHGGTVWRNRDGQLPSGVRYLEWDVNCKIPGQSRDAERIVTGDDGSAWYTDDHYATFTRMR
ncbi:ribonuclease domain-containing protein [Nocardia sp. CDC160]|uniref:ribonuclease domain-containing protein n=1 Tax=Nocardia sp. CDC160 TaxID=3112166 RepID=UPI002DB86560|nr:ribonuclease domain-containing protein [Nocardia sp. CDC160]MEC3917243.1 ribonuclease domain-containing protein [Nocardia sp. CDC160]